MIQLYGPQGVKNLTIRDPESTALLDMEYAFRFIELGLGCGFASSMIGKTITLCTDQPSVRISRGNWDKFTGALHEVGLIEKQAGVQTVIKFGRPIYPILTGLPKPTYDPWQWKQLLHQAHLWVQVVWQGKDGLTRSVLTAPPERVLLEHPAQAQTTPA